MNKNRFLLMVCALISALGLSAQSFPEADVWYRLLNRETAGNRENSYLGYYPETPWYIYNKADGSRANKIISDFVAAGNKADENNATEAEIDGQLWKFVEGTGANAGKYALVNKAHPTGAISNLIVNNNGELVLSLSGNNATNASRWLYLSNREEYPESVCWFDLSETTTDGGVDYFRPTFVNSINANGIYFALAAAGQKNQVIRMDTNSSGEKSTWWNATKYEPAPEMPEFPDLGYWYSLENRETAGNRSNSFLGYYPETAWYIYNKTDGSRAAMITSDFIAAGNHATAEGGATQAEIDGQLWRFVAGTGENEGKYALVNKAYPAGAISNAIVNNDGVAVTSLSGNNATNASRWLYVADREATPEQVCWFDWSTAATVGASIYYQPTFTNPINSIGIHFALAAAGQKNQVIRMDTNSSFELSTWWKPTPVEPIENEGPVEPGLTINTAPLYRISPVGNPHVGNDVCLGFYPIGAEVEWNVYSSETGELTMGHSQFVCVGTIADENQRAASPALGMQLWRLLPGEGDNAGKYALVNAAFPNGAISRVPYDNNGAVVANNAATNASRWKYIYTRSEEPENVCWFTLDDLSAEVNSYMAYITFEPLAPGYKYMQVAAGGQKRQVMRWNEAGSAEHWSFTPVEATVVSITEIAAESANSATEIFDLAGRRVAAPTRGFHIVNGTKTFVR